MKEINTVSRTDIPDKSINSCKPSESRRNKINAKAIKFRLLNKKFDSQSTGNRADIER